MNSIAQLKEKVNINADEGLEKEADVMGDKALQFSGKSKNEEEKKNVGHLKITQCVKNSLQKPVVQRIKFTSKTGSEEIISESEIVEHLNKWLINTMKNDRITTPSLETELKQNYLNWDEVHEKGRAAAR